MNFAAYDEGVLHAETLIDLYDGKPGMTAAHPGNLYPNDEDAQRSFFYGRQGVLALHGFYVSAFGVVVNCADARNELHEYHERIGIVNSDEFYYQASA